MTPEEKAAAYDGVVAERDGLKDKLKGANDEAKGHRLSAEASRGEAADFRGKWTASQADIEKLKGDHTSELERRDIDHRGKLTSVEKERDDARTEGRDKAVDSDLKLAARELGMVDLDALKLLDRKGVKLDKDGVLENGKELLEAMKEAKPYLFGEASKPGTETGNTSSTARKPAANDGKNKFDARTAKPEEVDARLAELTKPQRR